MSVWETSYTARGKWSLVKEFVLETIEIETIENNGFPEINS